MVYRDRHGNKKKSETWFADLWRGGRRKRWASHTDNKTEATRKLKEALGDGVVIERGPKRLSVLLDLVRSDYAREGRSSLVRLPVKIAHIHRLLGDPQVDGFDRAAIRAYQDRRFAEGAARGTVELETCVIGRGFSLAIELGMLKYGPKIPHLRLDNARQGFYRRADFEAIVGHLQPHWRVLMWTLYHTGWRPKEVSSRQWRHLDLERGWIRLEPHEAKTKHGRECPLVPELLTLLRQQREDCTAFEVRVGKIIPWVFYSPVRLGERLHCYSMAWKAARIAAGMPKALVYDCRRTRIRNLHRASVSNRASMEWAGHRDPKVHSRYGIVDEVMLTEARDKAAAFEEQLRGETPTVTAFTAGAKK